MAVPEEQVKALAVRWQYQCEQLARYLEKGPENMVDSVRQILTKIAEDANLAGVKLLSPAAMAKAESAADDTVFEVLEDQLYTPTAEQAAQPATVSATQTLQPVAVDPGNGVKTQHQCADGCGTLIPFASTFAPGHASKYHSMIRKVETGQMKREELPTLLQAALQWDKQGLATNPIIEMRRGSGPGGKVKEGEQIPNPAPPITTTNERLATIYAPAAATLAPKAAVPVLGTTVPVTLVTQTIAERLAYHEGEVAKLRPVHEAMQKAIAKLNDHYHKVLLAGDRPKGKKRARRKKVTAPAA